MTETRKLRVFLCHSSQDKPIVRELYERLNAEGWFDLWLDKEKLLLGQDFDLEIEKAVEDADAVIFFITKDAVKKTGYVQKELRLIYNAAMFRPEGVMFAIPLRLEECDPPPRFKLWQWGDYFGDEKEKTYKSLLKSLEIIYEQTLQLDAEERDRLQAEEFARKEREAKERARLQAEERARKNALENLRNERSEKGEQLSKKDDRKRRIVGHPYLEKFSQKTDIPIESGILGGGGKSELELLIRYMYYRSSESRSSIDPEMAIGQDYLRWHYNSDKDSFDFVVCDGVSQSFLGYIASEFLGEKLLKWLQEDGLTLVKMVKKDRQGGFEETITAKINSWQDEAKRQVKEKKLPSSLPPMVLTALEDSRENNGSETVFVCGHLSLEEKTPYLVLFWMGDVRFRLFDRDRQEIDTAAKWTNAERWSSKYGLKGRNMPRVWDGNLSEQKIARIMAYSDGLSTVERELPALSSADLQHKANQLLVSPSSDDISFIDILLSPFDKVIKRKFEDLPRTTNTDSLIITQWKLSDSEYLLSWEEVERADQYILLEASPILPWREIFRSTKPARFSVKDRLSGIYQYKLRVVFSDAYEEESREIIVEMTNNVKPRHSQPNLTSSVFEKSENQRIEVAQLEQQSIVNLAQPHIIQPKNGDIISEHNSLASEKKYRTAATLGNPAVIIFLLDVSASMGEIFEGGISRVEAVSKSLQKIAVKMVQRSTKGEIIVPRYRIGIFAYSSQTIDLLGGIKTIDQLAKLGVPQLTTLDMTDTAQAFVVVEDCLKKEIPYIQHCPAPLICHLTDGEYNGRDPFPIMRRISDLSVADGNVLIENIYIKKNLSFSAINSAKEWKGFQSENQLEDVYAKALFKGSSVIPESYRRGLHEFGYKILPNSRLFFPGSTIEFIDFAFAIAGLND